MLTTFEFALQELPWLFAIGVFVFGTIVGSFLNVCIYRIPAGVSVVFPGSHCSCGQKIRWYDNIPVLSWIILRGKARCCGRPFSIRYPLVEALTGVLFLIAWMQYSPMVALAGFLFLSFLIAATFIDLDHMIIPDRFSIGGAVLGVLISFVLPGLHGVESAVPLLASLEAGVRAIIGMLVGAGLVYWIAVLGEIVFRKPAMGEGDVKFVGFIGAFCGWQGAIFAMFGGALVGTLALLPLLLMGKLRRGQDDATAADSAPSTDAAESEEWTPGPSHIPFGPFLAVAGALYFLGLGSWVDAYFAEIVMLFGQFGE
jgi:leader peptidase (prepilin peptidase)/N-methyltransferase